MDKLAEGVGPEGRKLFENFLKQVNKLQEQQNAANRREPVSASCCHARSSSNALASFRSSVSKPSVNHSEQIPSSSHRGSPGFERLSPTTN